jgi:hypothetical protein
VNLRALRLRQTKIGRWLDEEDENVRFNDFGKSSVNILVYFHVEITDYATELEASERYYCESSTLRNNRALILPSPPARW